MKKEALLVLGAVLPLAGCLKSAPLMFVSKTTLGVELALPGAAQGASEPNITVGFKTFDAAYVPVVVDIEPRSSVFVTSSNLMQTRLEPTGTSSPGGQALAENTEGPAKRKAVSDQPSASPVVGESTARVLAQDTNLLSLSQTIDKINEELRDSSQKYVTAQKPEEKEALAKQQAVLLAAIDRLVQLSERLGDQKQDAFSVFSVIDANAWGRSSDAKAGIGVGKIFATGLAAQTVAEHYRVPYKYRACSRELIEAISVAYASAMQGDAKTALSNSLLALCPSGKAED